MKKIYKWFVAYSLMILPGIVLMVMILSDKKNFIDALKTFDVKQDKETDVLFN